MKTLYQLDSKGNTKVWMIEVVNHGDYSDIVIKSGRIDGKHAENVSKVLSGKNEGKSNETNHYTQSLSEMESKIQSQLKKGYVEDIADVKSSSILGSGIPAPMLAHKYHPTGLQKGSKTLTQLKLTGKKIIVQPKLDGNRCVIKIENGKAVMYTRSGDIMPVQLKHIIDDVESVGCVGTIFLDGELFSNKFSFNKLNGLIKREKVTQEDIEQRKHIKFHLYDAMLDSGYSERNLICKQFSSQNVVVILSIITTATDENIKHYLEQFLSNGYEGLMIRQLDEGYQNKRSWQLIKVKLFEDAEFKLVGFEEDARGGFVGSFIMEDDNGNVFNAGASGQDEDERTIMLNNPNDYIGKMATIEFFGRSEYGVPRFPKFKGIRE